MSLGTLSFSLFGLLPAESKRHHHPESHFPSVDSTCGIMNLTDVRTRASAHVHANTLSQKFPTISRHLDTQKHHDEDQKGTDNMFVPGGGSVE